MSSKGLSYKDAVRILGGEDSTVFEALDRLAGGILLLATAAGSPLALSLFEVKSEFIRLSYSLWKGLAEKVRGLGRYDKTERIVAAHAVIVITCYFDLIKMLDDKNYLLKFDDIKLLFQGDYLSKHPDWGNVPRPIVETLARAHRRLVRSERDRLRGNTGHRTDSPFVKRPQTDLDKRAQVTAATRYSPDSNKLRPIVNSLLCAELPIPAPQRPYGQTLFELGEFFANIVVQMREVIVGPEWDNVNTKEQETFTRQLRIWARDEGRAKYEVMFRQLATDFPEVAFWADMVSFQALQMDLLEIRADLRGIEQIQTGLQGLEKALLGLVSSGGADEKRLALSEYYKKALSRPIVETGELPTAGMRIPDLGTAYVNPNFRASEVDLNDRFYLESWWNDLSRQSRSDLQAFLFGFLTSAEAVRGPLLVLGQPGSGKSVLTKTLAARLPADEFLTVRVSLRDVAAEADIQVQIEQAFYEATGERISWPDLIRATGNALPVIFLDGFDELLQATGVSQSDYLERVATFQEREATNGRPCVVVVTSRTAVADRARIPIGGAVVVRLEPFDGPQIGLWLRVWNDWNGDYFRDHQLKALPLSSVLSQQDLASQPLLLLMLALYDADGNALQNSSADLGHAQLYERLLTRFAERDARKILASLPADELERQVEQDLMRLSVAAAAMFNRSRQWVTHSELDGDLTALMDESARSRASNDSRGFRGVRSLGETVLGQFFFIHEARAIVDGVKKGSCEFLHATFGEFLVARIVAKELEDLAKAEEFSRSMARRNEINDSFLYALLSFAPLSARATTIEFLRDLLGSMSPDRRFLLRELILMLFGSALDARVSNKFASYEPIALHLPARCAAYSANLLVLALLIGGPARGSELFRHSDDVVTDWSRQALLWRSQVSAEGWGWLSQSIRVARIEAGQHRDIVLRPSFAINPADDGENENNQGGNDQLYWGFERNYSRDIPQWSSGDSDQLRLRYSFTCDLDDDILVHSLSPMFDKLGPTITTFLGYSQERSSSCINALLRLWIASSTRATEKELTAAYDDCIDFGLAALHWFDPESARVFRRIVVRQLHMDLKQLPGQWRSSTRRRLLDIDDSDPGMRSWIDALVESMGLKNPG